MQHSKNNARQDSYKNKLDKIRQDMQSACTVAGRNPDEILLIAASKYADAEQIKEVAGLGISDFGENRAEALVEKYEKVGDIVNWHFIGHLQSRKVKMVVPLVQCIHSVESISLLEKINSEASKISKIQKILIEVNIAAESTKFGIEPGKIMDFLNSAFSYKNICVCGLMAMAPLTGNEIIIRNAFAGLKKMLDDIRKIPSFFMVKELSMGMSNDFKIAIEEGATMLRIGSLIFL